MTTLADLYSGDRCGTAADLAEQVTIPHPLHGVPYADGTYPAERPLPADAFDVGYRFRMVQAYPVISGVPNVYEADRDQLAAGFARCLAARNLRRTHELYLDREAAS